MFRYYVITLYRYIEILVSKDFQHRLVALFFGEEFGGVVSVFVFVDDYMLGCRYEAVLYTAISAEALLVGAGMEESYIERVVFLQFGQKYGIGVRVGVVVVLAVACQASEEDPLVFAVPMVDGEHDEALVYAPCVG